MKTLGWVLVAAVAILALASLDPALAGWSTEGGVAQLIGMRTWLMWGFAALAALALLTALSVGARRRRPARAIALAVVGALAAGGHLAVLDSRGLGAGSVPVADEARDDEITVLTANVRGDDADGVTTDAVARLITSSGADVVALPEGEPVVDEIIAALPDGGAAFQVFPAFGAGANRGTALLVARDLGEYGEVEAPVGAVRVEAVGHDGPPIAAVHPISLTRSPVVPWAQDRTEQWSSELAQVQALFRTMPGGIVAGDLNATPDHRYLRETGGYMDAGSTVGIGAYGTYPSALPGVLGTAIDRVLVDRGRFSVTEGGVADVPGSDHRAVVVRVRDGAA